MFNLNTKNISMDTVIVQEQGHIVSDMDGEKVMMSIEKGKYYNLGMVGGVIWDKIGSPITVDEIIQSLVDEFSISHDECEQQVIFFLEQLYNEKLIKVGKEAIR